MTDLPVVARWTSEAVDGSGKGQRIAGLSASFEAIAISGFAQTFTGCREEEILWAVDISTACTSDVQLDRPAKSGDYLVHFTLSPVVGKEAQLLTAVLQYSLAFFFSFREVQQLYLELCHPDKQLLAAYHRAGFVRVQTNDYGIYAAQLLSIDRRRHKALTGR